MLQQDIFYFASVRKVVTAFGSLFSDLHIQRQDLNGSPGQTMKVPLSYGPKEKYLVRITQNKMPNVDDQIEMVLPRMSYELRGFEYDSERKLVSTGHITKKLPLTNRSLATQYNPVPYNLTFELNIMVRNVNDGLMIIEQILPFFTPDYTVTINDVPDMDLKKDVPITLMGMTTEDTWDGSFTDRRSITYALTFIAKAWIYPPILNRAGVILDSRVNLFLQTAPQATTPVSTDRAVVSPSDAAKEDEHEIIETLTVNRDRNVLISPLRATLTASQTQQFAFANASTAILSPSFGTLSNTGLYTAPSFIPDTMLVTIRATSNFDPSSWSEAVIVLEP